MRTNSEYFEPTPPGAFVGAYKVHEDAGDIKYQSEHAVGFDIPLVQDELIPYGSSALVRTGWVIKTPPNLMLALVPRSSTHKKYGIKLANTIGIIDPDYCGETDEILLNLQNVFPKWPYGLHHGNDRFTSSGTQLRKGDRLIQGIFVPIYKATFDYSYEPGSESRGGFGSTG